MFGLCAKPWMMSNFNLSVYIEEQWKQLKNYFKIYFIYTFLVIIITVTLVLIPLTVIRLIFPDFGNFYFEFFQNSANIQSIIYMSLLLVIVMSSISYLAHEYINKHDEGSGNKEMISLEQKIEDLKNRINISSASERFKIISYRDLIDVENSHICSEINIITNSLVDDLNDDHFFKVIEANLHKGKKYRFIVPNIDSNRRDGCALLSKLFSNLKKANSGQAKTVKEFGNQCEVYLVHDEVFRICAFRDITIYGAGINDFNTVGYVEIPYISKDNDPYERFFIQIDNRVCAQMVNDISVIIKKSKYFEPLSCELV